MKPRRRLVSRISVPITTVIGTDIRGGRPDARCRCGMPTWFAPDTGRHGPDIGTDSQAGGTDACRHRRSGRRIGADFLDSSDV